MLGNRVEKRPEIPVLEFRMTGSFPFVNHVQQLRARENLSLGAIDEKVTPLSDGNIHVLVGRDNLALRIPLLSKFRNGTRHEHRKVRKDFRSVLSPDDNLPTEGKI